MASIHSPKNKFCGIVNFDEALPEIGSNVRFTWNDKEQLKGLCEDQAQNYPCTITIMENNATYPSFDWQVVEKYNFNKK